MDSFCFFQQRKYIRLFKRIIKYHNLQQKLIYLLSEHQKISSDSMCNIRCGKNQVR